MQLFTAYRKEMKACVAASWRACVGLFQMLPVLPLVSCLASLALFASDYEAAFQGGPVTVVQAFCYEAGGQLLSIRNGSCTTGTPYVSMTYDGANRQQAMADATGTTGWTYDGAGNALASNGPQGNIAYAYDAAGRRATMALPGSGTVTYGYDAASQLTSVTDWQSRTTSFTYAPFGPLDTVVRPNGTSTNDDHDAGGRLGLVEHAKGATMLAKYVYAVDADGNRTALTISGSAVAGGTETYAYDDLDRLTTWTTTVGGSGSASYAYDENGNRTSVTSGGATTTYTVDAADQLTELRNGSGTVLQSFAHDANGNRIGSTPAGGTTDQYGYDWRNRMTSATASGTTVTYTYAGDDRRATRTVAGSTTTYLWDRQAGLPELVDDGTSVYLQTGGDVQSSIAKGNNAATYDLLDGQGSVRLQTDGAGAATGTANADPWGNARGAQTTTGALGWVGEQRDPSTGLTHLRARDYDPLRGRFTSRDTLSPNGSGTKGYDPYGYAQGNPATLTDPSGHSPEAIAGLVGAMVGLYKAAALLEFLPPAAKGLVTALIMLGVVVLRMLIVMILFADVVKQYPLLGTAVGGALTLLGLVKLLKPMDEWGKRCVANPMACTQLPDAFPSLPDDVCSILCEARDRIRNLVSSMRAGVAGVCTSSEAGVVLSIGAQMCAVADVRGNVGFSFTLFAAVGVTFLAQGPSFGAMVSTVPTIWGLAGWGTTVAAAGSDAVGGKVEVTESGDDRTLNIDVVTGFGFAARVGKSYTVVRGTHISNIPGGVAEFLEYVLTPP